VIVRGAGPSANSADAVTAPGRLAAGLSAGSGAVPGRARRQRGCGDSAGRRAAKAGHGCSFGTEAARSRDRGCAVPSQRRTARGRNRHQRGCGRRAGRRAAGIGGRRAVGAGCGGGDMEKAL